MCLPVESYNTTPSPMATMMILSHSGYLELFSIKSAGSTGSHSAGKVIPRVMISATTHI